MAGAYSYPEQTQPLVTDSEQRSLVKIAQLLYDSGGGGEQQVFSGDYGGGTPTDTPTASAATAYDTSNGTEWHWYANAWH